MENRYAYKPYGEELSRSGTGSDPAFRWVGSLGYKRTGRSYAEEYTRRTHYSTRLDITVSSEQFALLSPLVGTRPSSGTGELSPKLSRANPHSPKYRSQAGEPKVIVVGRGCVAGPLDPNDLGWGETWCEVTTGVTCLQYVQGPPIEYVWECVRAHEERHRSDLSGCCRSAFDCIKNNKDTNRRCPCGTAYKEWEAVIRPDTECNAYFVEYMCLMGKALKHRCYYGGTTSKRCEQILDNLDFVRDYIETNCGNRYALRPMRMACPFPLAGEDC